MNAECLLAHHERIADAPDAIARLRRFVLDLAVRGKLVPQDPNDEPASELLKRIAAEKARLVKAGEIKKQEPMASVGEDEQPFNLPSGWSATRLAVVAVCLDYMRRPINQTERDQRIANKRQSELFPYFGATQQQGWIDDYIFDEELVLLGEDGVPFFDPMRSKAYLISGKTWVNNHAHVFRGILVSHPFLVHCLNVFDYSGRVVGATRSKLNQARAADIPIMLPPLAEQHRIVAKADELMALCDRLEAARVEREATRDKLTAASLARLNAPDADSFRDDARFALNILPTLTARPDQIKQLRQTILNLAVRGKLVPQDPADGMGGDLLAALESARSKLSSGGHGRRSALVHEVSDHEKYLDLPTSWTWARICQIGVTQTGTSPSSSNPDLFGALRPVR
jgi:type I restriction enzyme S subunit